MLVWGVQSTSGQTGRTPRMNLNLRVHTGLTAGPEMGRCRKYPYCLQGCWSPATSYQSSQQECSQTPLRPLKVGPLCGSKSRALKDTGRKEEVKTKNAEEQITTYDPFYFFPEARLLVTTDYKHNPQLLPS